MPPTPERPADAPVRPLEDPGHRARLALLFGVTAAGMSWAAGLEIRHPGAIVAAGAAVLVMVVVAPLLPWRRWSHYWQALPAMGCYPVGVLLGYGTGRRADFILLLAVPVMWLALFHSRTMLLVGIALFLVARFAPPLVWPRAYGPFDPVHAVIAVVLAGGGGLALHHLTARNRAAERQAARAAAEALEHERQTAARLRELDQIKNDFVATVSHDLRTPLTSILGNTEVLLDGDAGALTPRQRRLLEAVARNGRRLHLLVADLLMLSRIESGAVRIAPRDVPVGDVIRGVLDHTEEPPSPDVAVVLRLPDEPLLVRGDPDQLERVVANLLSNARKFTPPGGRVTIDVGATGDRVRISVSDTGIGIPDDELPLVFDRFYRSSRSQDRDRPGTGLGLTIAKSIVEQHGGTITAAAAECGGTTFCIELPRLVAAGRDPADGGPAPAGAPEPADRSAPSARGPA